MATYIEIPEAEMHDFLTKQGFVVVGVDGTTEKVFAKCRKLVNRNQPQEVVLSIRVYTTIEAGSARSKGQDAIRVTIWMKRWDRKLDKHVPICLKTFKRVHRVQNWRGNLQARINEAMHCQFAACQDCGGLMIERSNRQKGSKFLGCVNYPECKYTRNLP